MCLMMWFHQILSQCGQAAGVYYYLLNKISQ
uniref:Uncharacterized protein n=1 Tax=Anguilla anguilla TaxID=7936 RepID=A0A0E9PRN9_ANGAN